LQTAASIFVSAFAVIVVCFFYVLDVERFFLVERCEEGVGNAAHFDG
jgi:hypothetical protein